MDWAVHTSDIVGVAERWKKAGVQFQGPTPGSRARPDGKMLHWQTLNVSDDRDGLIPFFIQWGADTVHPSADAPSGCKLEGFAVVTPETQTLEAEFQKLGNPRRSRERQDGAPAGKDRRAERDAGARRLRPA